MAYAHLTIVGNVGRDPELKTTQSGRKVATIAVGVTCGYGENAQTSWIDVNCWERMAETACNYLKKGSKVLFSGDFSERHYTTRDGREGSRVTLDARAMDLLDSKPKEDLPY